MTELEVRLSADIKRLTSELAKAEKELKGFGRNAEREGKKVERSFQKTGKGAKNVTPTLLEFNRVIQDAPFGIQGVANNLTQLTQNFGDLRKSAGGTRSALSSLVAGFAGPAGILFAVSAVTSLLVTYGDKLKFATSLTSELSDATKEFVGSALSEISTLESLVKIAGNVNLSYKVRQGAIDKLNEKYPEFLGNLTQETINSNETATAVERLTKSLIQQAKIRGVQATIEKRVSDRSGKLTLALVERQEAARRVEAEIANLSKTYKDFFKVEGGIPLGEQTTQAVQQLEKNLGGLRGPIGSRLNELIGEFVKADKGVKEVEGDIQNSLTSLQSILNNFTIGGLNLDPDEVKEVVVTAAKNIEQAAKSVTPTPIYTDAELATIFGISEEAGVKLNSAAAKISEGVNKTLQGAATPVKAYFSEVEAQLDQFALRAEQTIKGSIGQAFSTLGQVIGEGLINGANVFSSIGQGIIAGFGQFLSSMGQLLIEYGTMAVLKGKLDLAIAAGGPLAIGAGLAAIAAGVALSAIGAAFSSAAGGGFSGAGSGAVSGQGSTDTGGRISNGGNNFGATGSSGGTVVFEISGQKLVGVLNRTLQGNSRLGGNLALG
jgi:molybdenum-dependent DNA-binding transcriptional regulator ModE